MKRLLDPDLLVKQLNDYMEYRSMMQRFPRQAFVSLQCWPTLQKHLAGYLITWLHTKPLLHAPLSIRYDLSYPLTFGQLHYLYNESLPLGYLIALPKLRLEVTDSYAVCSPSKKRQILGKVTDLDKLTQVFGNVHLSVFTLGNNQMLASTDKRLADFLR